MSWLNEALRWLIGAWIRLSGRVAAVLFARRCRGTPARERRLRARLGVREDAPVRTWGPELQTAVERFAAGRDGVKLASTSGTTSEPKRIAYTRRRVLRVAWVFVESFARMASALRLPRTVLYLFGALDDDDSLTGLMLDEGGRLPPYLSGLQAPYRVHGHPELVALAERYGSDAVRLWVLALSNPGVLYATNPSTLSTFFERLRADWPHARALVVDWVADPQAFSPLIRRAARRIRSRAAAASLRAISEAATQPPDADRWMPGLAAYICWDGGYVRPFLDRLARDLPPSRYKHVPMYAMSTETLMTVPDYSADPPAFLPTAPAVLYEWLPADAPDDRALLRSSAELEEAQEYTLVVSDEFGLTRYQTEDIFRCDRRVRGLPDLRFVRRRGLAFSFTGEKLTGEQADEALTRLRAEHPTLSAATHLSCAPVSVPDQPPSYALVVVGGVPDPAHAETFDRLLGVLNHEYASKRRSGRLGGVQLRAMDLDDYLMLVRGETTGWQSQFKFMPLLTRPID